MKVAKIMMNTRGNVMVVGSQLMNIAKKAVKVVLVLTVPFSVIACGSQPAQDVYSVPKGIHSQHCYITQSQSQIWLEQEDEWLALPPKARQQFEQVEVNWLEENFLIVSSGQRSSAGYGIALSNWLLEQDHWQVTRITHQPPAGSMQAQMITSPCLLVKIPKSIKSFTLKDEQGQTLGRWPY
jgi:hypothetical protein